MVTFESGLKPSTNPVYTQVVIVSDETASISAEVRAASDAYEIVITAGGVGPTRDDVTLAGVAEALGKPLVR
jgi:FAD synthetase